MHYNILYYNLNHARSSSPRAQIAYEISVNCSILGQRLDFLIKNGLVEEQELGKTTLYTITERGIAVLEALNFQKHLSKIANRIKATKEELQVLKST